VINATPRPFTPGVGTRYQFCRRLGWPQSQSGRVRKISPPRCTVRVRFSDHSARSEPLHRLSYPGPQNCAVQQKFTVVIELRLRRSGLRREKCTYSKLTQLQGLLYCKGNTKSNNAQCAGSKLSHKQWRGRCGSLAHSSLTSNSQCVLFVRDGFNLLKWRPVQPVAWLIPGPVTA
jgi:hypothetical protein